MTDRMHPLTAAGVGVCGAAVGFAVGGVVGTFVVGLVLVVLGAVADGDSADAPDECPHCGIRNPGAPDCRWCDEAVRQRAGAAASVSLSAFVDEGADDGA